MQDSPAAVAGTSPCISLNIFTSLENAQGKLDTGVAGTGHYTETLQPLPLPNAEALIAIQDSFPEVRKRARALFLLDVSESMVQEPGVTKLQRARDAVRKALDHFMDEGEIGLAAFSHVGDGPCNRA